MRRVFILFLGLACLCVAPMVTPMLPTAPTSPEPGRTIARPTTDADFARLITTDVLAALEVSLARYKQEVRGYRCIMDKRERLGGRLGPSEQIRIAFREEPFAVLMTWEQGAGLATATLYATGENDGQLVAKSRLGVLNSDPLGSLARSSSRYTIQDFGLYRGCERTHKAWQTARNNGRLHTESLGPRPVPQCGGRVCHVVRRRCDPPEVDNFSVTETEIRSAERFPKDAIGQVTLFLDAETWLHVGSELLHPDGSLIGSYYFRSIDLNPVFPPWQFTPAALRK